MGAPPITIRPAESADLGAMCGLLKELFALEADFSFDPARQMRGLSLLLGRAGARLLAAEVEGRVVGMCSVQLLISTAEGGPAALVEDLVMEKQWRGRGIGRALLTAAAEWAGEHGAYRLQLLADQGNRPALDFYQRLGWKRTRLICLRHRGG